MHVEKVASEVNVAPQVPRTTGRQCHRENTEHDSVEEYYRRCIVLPLLDNLIQQMNERFSQTQITASKLLHLIPSIVCTHSEISLEEVASFYDSDLPNSALASTEAWRWRAKWQAEDAERRPSTLEKALKQCDRAQHLHSFVHCLYAPSHIL